MTEEQRRFAKEAHAEALINCSPGRTMYFTTRAEAEKFLEATKSWHVEECTLEEGDQKQDDAVHK
jgi:hypothetical protein